MTRAVWVFLALLLSGAAGAQLDPKAQPFLDAYTASFENAKMPGFNGDTVESMDMTLCMNFNVSGESSEPDTPPEMCTRTVADYTRQWLRSEIKGEFGFKVVYRDGKARVRSASLGDEPFTLPQSETRKLEKQLETLFEQLQDIENGEWAQEGFESSHYDGFVRYGNVVAGEQVTTTMTIPSLGMVEGDTQAATTQFIFNKEKVVIGMVIQTPQGKMLSVPKNPKAKNPMAMFMNTTYYTLKDGKPVLQSTMRLARFRINAPLNEALFTLKPKP